MSAKKPIPLFDVLESIDNNLSHIPNLSPTQQRDIDISVKFLLSYSHNKITQNSYRREIERLLQWCLLKSNKTLKQLTRDDMDSYIKFCKKPNKSWIGIKKVARFKSIDGMRKPNPDWRPFVVTLPKSRISQGEKPDTDNYELSQKSLKEIFTVTSSFFNFLIQENYAKINPVQQIRQKTKYFTKVQSQRVVRKLSELQWGYVIESAHILAKENDKYERTLFIMNALYGMYLRISELVATDRWYPKMGDFERDNDGLWWFTTVGKGNKERKIAVSNAMLKALKRWRKHLGLSQLPSPGETTPLISKIHGKGAVTSTRPIRVLVQECFNHAIDRLRADGFDTEADQLMTATVHWLRHTGISDDVKIRPREHVRDDAGHSSSSITDKYIDVEHQERYQSAKKKQIVPAGFEEIED